MKFIVPKKDVRIFKRITEGSPRLRRTDGIIYAGTEIEIGVACTMTYDDRDQLCVPITIEGEEFFLIVEEIGNLNAPLTIPD